MKIKSVLASVAACAIAISAMAISASASTVDYKDTIKLDGKEATAPKMWQYDLTNLAGNGTLTKITFDVTCPFAATGWSGGGGAVGMGYAAPEGKTDGWWQVDFPAEGTFVDGELHADTFSVSIDVPETYNTYSQTFESGIVQIGWWWGAGDTAEITNLKFEFADGGSQQADDSSKADDSSSKADDSSSKADDSSSKADDSSSKADDGKKNTQTTGTNTGDAGVGIAVAGLALAGAAAFAARRKH